MLSGPRLTRPRDELIQYADTPNSVRSRTPDRPLRSPRSGTQRPRIRGRVGHGFPSARFAPCVRSAPVSTWCHAFNLPL